MANSKLVEANKKIEDVVVGGFNKMTDKIVDNYLTKDGELVEEAKERLSAEQKAREEKSKKEMEQRRQRQQDIMEENKRRAE